MATTYTLISSNTLSGSATSVSFSSIPQIYTDLLLRISARTDLASNGADIDIRYNSDSGSNYSSTWLYANTSLTAYRTSSSTLNRNYQIGTGTADGASIFGHLEFYIPNYTNSIFKPNLAYGSSTNNSTTAWTMITNAGLYSSTTAISSIQIYPVSTSGYNFTTGSSFSLYGIKSS